MKLKKSLRRKYRSYRAFPKLPAIPFLVRPCESRVSFIGSPPRVFLTRRAYETMFHIVDLAENEVGWLGTVERRGNDFVIDEIFLFKQKVHATETDISPEGLAEVGHKLIMERPDGVDVCNSLRFWGHSHVEMDTNPSSSDELQMDTLREAEHPWFIRGIFNKRGKAEFSVFFYEEGLRIDDVPWSIWEDIDEGIRAEIKADMDAKVSYQPYTPPAVISAEGALSGTSGLALLGEVSAFGKGGASSD